MVVEEKSRDVVNLDRDDAGVNKVCCGEAEINHPIVIGDCDEGEEFDGVDSGAELDDIDSPELGDVGAEFIQIEDQTCSIPLALFDLPDLGDILSLDVWNECLSEDERFELTKYLPGMDEATFMWTLKELLSGENFHFGNPVHRLFEMMKGGLCEPRVALYRQGLNMLQKCKHYQQLRKYHNTMVSTLYQIRDVWIRWKDYSIEEKLQKLNHVRSQQKPLMYENAEDICLDEASSGRDDPDENVWSRTLMETKARQKKASRLDHQATSGQISGKRNYKALINLAEPISPLKQPANYRSHVHYGSSSAFPTHKKRAWCEMDPILGERKEECSLRKMDDSFSYVSGIHNSGKRHELSSLKFKDLPLFSKDDKFVNMGSHQVNQLSDITVLTTKPSGDGSSHDFGKKMSYFGNINAYTSDYKTGGKGKKQIPASAPIDGESVIPDPSGLFWQSNYRPEASTRDRLAQDNQDTRRKRPQMRLGSLDLDMNSYSASLSKKIYDTPPHLSNYRAEFSAEYMGGNCVQNGAPDITALRGIKSISQSDETESDSSKHGDEESIPLLNREFIYTGGSGSNVAGFSPENAKYLTKKKNIKRDGHGNDAYTDTQIAGTCSEKGKWKSGVVMTSNVHNVSLRAIEDDRSSNRGASSNNGSERSTYVLGNPSDLFGERGERPIALDPSMSLSHQLNECDDFHGHEFLEASESVGGLKGMQLSANKGKKEFASDEHAKPCIPYSGCSRSGKKLKRREKGICMEPQDEYDHFHSVPHHTSVPEYRNVEETETGCQFLEMPDPQCTDMELTDVGLEAKAQRIGFTLIKPTVHTGLPFSVIHLLSAIHIVMTNPQLEDPIVVSQAMDEGMQQVVDNAENHENVDNSVPHVNANVPSLTIQDIVNQVRSNPGDPCILETEEPLQDLVRGVLKIFSSKKAPLGAKDWKPLAAYRKTTKSWYWIGPILRSSSSGQETVEEVTSPEAWGIPHKTLVKLVDSFANWLISSQEVLQQLGSLPALPESLFQINLEEKERFKDQRAQKSACTFDPSAAEVRDYFRREEALRYSIPDRAFAYTAADGSKSMVAPLKRFFGKPTSKPRDHFLLKPDRPPHVTILCLVRDAAARLPGCVGTRSDICTLMRDSQYIVEDVPDAQLNQIVSGALDRLHYEHDPCVRYENDRKLWIYLHRERVDEDFEDDGTSSSRRWKRQKKDPSQQPDQDIITRTDPDQIGLENSDVQVQPSACVDEEDTIVDIM